MKHADNYRKQIELKLIGYGFIPADDTQAS